MCECKYCGQAKNEPLLQTSGTDFCHRSCQEEIDAIEEEMAYEALQNFYASLEYGDLEFIQNYDGQ